MRPIYVGVIGPGQCSDFESHAAELVGRLLAEAKAIVVCGGMAGVMAAASKGASQAGGTVLGILPTDNHERANPFVTVAVPTGMGETRNALVVRASDALVAVGGEWGTLSEIALARKMDRAVIGLGTWQVHKPGTAIEAARPAATPDEAVRFAITAAKHRRDSLKR